MDFVNLLSTKYLQKMSLFAIHEIARRRTVRTIASLEKGLKILEIIAETPEGIRVKEISKQMEMPTSNICLFLNALVQSGFVTKDAQAGCYYASQRFFEIAQKAELTKYSRMIQEARPHMQKLRDDINENVLLAVISGHDTQFIEQFRATRSVQILHNPDVTYPPHVTAGGKAILAFLGPKSQQKYLEAALYHPFTEKTIIDPKLLQQEFNDIVDKGYAINRGEYEPEVMAISSPIRSAGGVIGAIVVQFPSFRYQEEDLPSFGERIKAAAYAIEESLSRV
jgi:IclR family acetate operon transcriptional repressor